MSGCSISGVTSGPLLLTLYNHQRVHTYVRMFHIRCYIRAFHVRHLGHTHTGWGNTCLHLALTIDVNFLTGVLQGRSYISWPSCLNNCCLNSCCLEFDSLLNKIKVKSEVYILAISYIYSPMMNWRTASASTVRLSSCQVPPGS